MSQKEVSFSLHKYFNERDIEIPLLLNFISSLSINSLLDVGAFDTGLYYAQEIRSLLGDKRYDGVDVRPDNRVIEILSHYYVGNILDVRLPSYDVVTSVSTIEHCGITTYKEKDYLAERKRVFHKIIDLAKYGFFLSFPFGQEGFIENGYANITDEELSSLEASVLNINRFDLSLRFFFNEFPQGREKWFEVDRSFASTIPCRIERGCQCICVMSGRCDE